MLRIVLDVGAHGRYIAAAACSCRSPGGRPPGPWGGRIPHHFPHLRGRECPCGSGGRSDTPRFASAAGVRMRALVGRTVSVPNAPDQGDVRFRIARSDPLPAPLAHTVCAGPHPNAPPPNATVSVTERYRCLFQNRSTPVQGGGVMDQDSRPETPSRTRAGPSVFRAARRAEIRGRCHCRRSEIRHAVRRAEDRQVSAAIERIARPSPQAAQPRRGRPNSRTSPTGSPPDATPARRRRRPVWHCGPPSFTHMQEGKVDFVDVEANRFCTCPRMSRPCPSDSAS